MDKKVLAQIARLQEMIDSSKKTVFFGGAGVSTESGIPDFRSAHGLFTSDLSAEEIVSHDYFFEQTENFYKFYKDKMMYLTAEPNACHKKLAEWEKAGRDITIITQNIDGLHQKAGSSQVIELHGSIHVNHCLKCGREFDAAFVKNASAVPYCPYCGGLIKPDVVLYGEPLDERVISKAISALREADLLIIGGTSLKVYPAASFIDFYQGQNKVFINLNDNPLRADYMYIDAKIGEVFSQLK